MNEENEGLNILTDEEYEAIKQALINAGITNPEVIEKTVRGFESAAVKVSVLDLLVDGLAKIVGITDDGSAKIGLLYENLEDTLGEDDGPSHEELMKFFGRN